MLLSIDDRCEGRGDHDTFHRWRVGLDGFQDTGCSLDSRVQEIFHRVLNIEVEGRCCVEDIVEWRVRFDSLRCNH